MPLLPRALLLAAALATLHAGAAPPASSPAGRALATLQQRYLDGLFRAKPHLASYMGDHRHEEALPDLSAAGIVARVAELRSQQRALAALDRRGLTRDQRIDLETMSDGLELELLEWTVTREQTWDPRLQDGFTHYDPRELVAGRLSDLIHSSLPEPGRRRSVTAQLAALPRFLLEKERLLAGPVSRVHLDQAVKDNRGRLEFLETEVKPYALGAPATERARQAAVAALRRHQAFLEETLPARATRDWRLGPEAYRRKFPLALQTDLTPEEMTARARAAFEAARAELLALAVRLAAGFWPGEAPPTDAAGQARLIQRVRDELAKDHPAAPDFVAAHARSIEGLRQFILEKGLLRLPPADTLSVLPEPEFKRGAVGAEYLSPGFLDRALAWHGTYYVDPVDPTWPPEKQESYLRANNTAAVQLTAAHEAYPGHHTQAWYARADLNPLRATLWSGPFAEGWAVYATTLLTRLGYGGDRADRFRFLDTQGALVVAGNAILDAGLQGGAMTDEEALRFMNEQWFQEPAQSEKKLLRAKLDSTQLCQYFLGHAELDALEAEVRRQGPFDQRAFDEAVLSHGTIGVKRIRQYLLP